MSAKNTKIDPGTTMIVAEIGLTAEEQATIISQLGKNGESYIRDQGANFELLSLSIMAADTELKEAQKALRATKEFAKVQKLQQEIKRMNNLKKNAFLKFVGVFESALRGVRGIVSLHQKIQLVTGTIKGLES